MDPFNPWPHSTGGAPGMQPFSYGDDGLGGLGGGAAAGSSLDDGLGGLGPPPPAPGDEDDDMGDGAGGLLAYDGGLLPSSLYPPSGQGGLLDGEEEGGEEEDDEEEDGDDAGGLLGGTPSRGAGWAASGAGAGDDEEEEGAEEDPDLNSALNAAFDNLDRRPPTRAQDSGDDLDAATEDEALGEEEQAEDPALAEQQRQSAWARECYDAMTEAQRNRLEAYNRSSLQKKTMKRVVQELTGSGATNHGLLIALCSVTKMFVGELVETARQIAAQQGHAGALLPSHIRAAHQALSEDNRVPRRGPAKPLRLY